MVINRRSFSTTKKTEDLKERYYYGLLPDPQEQFKIRFKVPGLRYDEQESLEKQIREYTDSLMDKDDNGNHKGNKHGKAKEIEIGCSHKRPFVSRLDLDYQNRNKIEDLHRQIREGRGHLDLWKGFWKEEYDYDPNGNITQKRNGWGEIDYHYNPANQLTQVGNRAYQYDQNGNLTKELLGKSFIDYQYNYENRLVKADDHVKHPLNHWKDAGDVSYGYDALGRKVKKEIDPERKKETEVEYYIYNGLGLNILAEYQIDLKKHGRHGVKGEIDRVKEYYYGNGFLLASQQIDEPNKHHHGRGYQPEISFYHHDVLRSVVMLTDKNGRVEERYQYDVWGKAYEGRFEESFPGKGHPNNVYGFTGQRYQPELGVYSFAYRDYSPRTMRWMTEDPVRDGLNWSLYCNSDPVNYIDAYGLLTMYELNHDIEPTPSATITVTSVITENYDGKYNDTQLTGMTGYQEIEYQSPNMSKSYTVENVRWGEDDTKTEKYENPAEPGVFDVTVDTTGTFPVGIEHPEEGIKVHAGYWSEGCVVLGSLSNKDILDDIIDIKAKGGDVTAILIVEDKRNEEEKEERPLPYAEKKNESCSNN